MEEQLWHYMIYQKSCSVEKEKLKGDSVRARLYYKLIEECGPGDLATLGTGNNHA